MLLLLTTHSNAQGLLDLKLQSTVFDIKAQIKGILLHLCEACIVLALMFWH